MRREVQLVVVADADGQGFALHQAQVFAPRRRILQLVLVERAHKVADVHAAEQLFAHAARNLAVLARKKPELDARADGGKLRFVAVQQRVFALEYHIVGIEVVRAPGEGRRRVIAADHALDVRHAAVRAVELQPDFRRRENRRADVVAGQRQAHAVNLAQALDRGRTGQRGLAVAGCAEVRQPRHILHLARQIVTLLENAGGHLRCGERLRFAARRVVLDDVAGGNAVLRKLVHVADRPLGDEQGIQRKRADVVMQLVFYAVVGALQRDQILDDRATEEHAGHALAAQHGERIAVDRQCAVVEDAVRRGDNHAAGGVARVRLFEVGAQQGGVFRRAGRHAERRTDIAEAADARRGRDAQRFGAAGLHPHAEAAVDLLHAHHLFENHRALVVEILLVDAFGQHLIRRQHAEVEVAERHAALADADGVARIPIPPGEEKRRAAQLAPQNEVVELVGKAAFVLRL